MDVEQNRTIHRTTNNFIYSYLSYSNLPAKYKTIDFNSFFLLIAAKHISKYEGGLFTVSELVAVSGLGSVYIGSWFVRVCNAGFLLRLGRSGYEFTHFGRLSIKQFNRSLYRCIKNDKLPSYEDFKYNAFKSLAVPASGVGSSSA